MHITLEHTKILKCPLLKEFESSEGRERTDAYVMKAWTKYQESVCASHRSLRGQAEPLLGMVLGILLRESTLLSLQDQHVPPLKSLSFLLKEVETQGFSDWSKAKEQLRTRTVKSQRF